MSLVDDWETQDSATDRSGAQPARNNLPASGLNSDSYQPPAQDATAPIFSLEAAKRAITRGRGHVTALAAANNYISVVTSHGWLLRYDLSQGDSPVTELELTRSADTTAEGVWVDPSGVHHVLLLQQFGSYETLYFHTQWKKAKSLTKLKGLQITAVGWNPESCSAASTGDIAVGTTDGKLVAVSFEEKEKKERGGKVFLGMSEEGEAIHGIAQLPLQQGQLLLLLATAKRLQAFVGPTSLEKLGEGYHTRSGPSNYVELPSDIDSGLLACYMPAGAIRPSRFVWLAGPGLYRGTLDLGQDPSSELDYLGDRSLLPLPLSASGEGNPIAIAQTEFHELVLYASCLHIVNRVSKALVQELPFSSRTTDIHPWGPPLGMAEDIAAGSIFIFTADTLIEVICEDEERDLWQIYLDRKDFANAFRRCRTQAQRDAVNGLEAEMAFQEGRYLAAATSWGKVTASQPSFEELALKFVGAGSPDALQTYLLTKLDTLAPADKAQATMIATWLTELSLDRLNRALLEQGEGTEADDRVEQLTEELRAFLKRQVALLDARTTIGLLASYGRLDDLMHYASYRQDNEAVLECLLQREDAERAIALLRRPDVSQELLYKFAPGLMALAPSETVDAWMSSSPALDPKRLLPALLRYTAKDAPKACRTHTLRYLSFCLNHLLSEDPAIHQLAVALYCSEGEEEKLMEYLERAKNAFGQPLYDPQTALQLSRQHNLISASIELLWQLQLFESVQEAVTTALQLDMQRAVGLVHREQEDEGLQRKLWLSIAHHLIQAASATSDEHPTAKIKEIKELMREAGSKLKIEDILPLFPDFVQIDNFKDPICQSLEEYNAQIADLKTEMDDVTRISDRLRKDLAMLERRAATLSEAEPCASCGRPVGQAVSENEASNLLPPYLLFPTGNAFHGSCLLKEVMELAPQNHRQRLQKLLVRKGRQVAQSSDRDSEPLLSKEEIRSSLHNELSQEDPYNGEMVIKNIDKPFILPEEGGIIESWQI